MYTLHGTRQPFFGQEIQPGAPPAAPVAGTPPSPPPHLSPPALPKARDVRQGKVQQQPPAQLVPFAAGMPGAPFQPLTPVLPYDPGAGVALPGKAQPSPGAAPTPAIPKPAMVRAHSAPAFVREPPQFQGYRHPRLAVPPPAPATSPAPGSTPGAASPAPGRTPMPARSAPDEGRAKASEKSMPRFEFVSTREFSFELIDELVVIWTRFMLKNELASDTSKTIIEKNIAHIIRYATKESRYMEVC
ncbi:hypothetical protein ANCCAN_07094 [Ancylostoma caninum]|uniref:Uncharacterized protein n=1 Tax=Ancylostoma caninum TaxID=29170 RepID=A0A368GVA0_ANCCA|nr:hypothetical protein ANCCAN_07094 [Ancylostoma caninum]